MALWQVIRMMGVIGERIEEPNSKEGIGNFGITVALIPRCFLSNINERAINKEIEASNESPTGLPLDALVYDRVREHAW